MKLLIFVTLPFLLIVGCASSGANSQVNDSHDSRRGVASFNSSTEDGVYLTSFPAQGGSDYRIKWINVQPAGQKKFYVAKIVVHVANYGRCGGKLKLIFHGRSPGIATVSLASVFDDSVADPCFLLGRDQDVELRLPSPVLNTRDLKEIQVVFDNDSPLHLLIPAKPSDGGGDL